MATKKKEEIFYFARERHMASVVWDAQKNTALAEFTKAGVYATAIPAKAKHLRAMGYLEVSRDEIIARGLPVPEPDYSYSVEYQPGGPRGYTHTGQAPAAVPQARPFGKPEQGLDPADFPEGPKRTLR